MPSCYITPLLGICIHTIGVCWICHLSRKSLFTKSLSNLEFKDPLSELLVQLHLAQLLLLCPFPVKQPINVRTFMANLFNDCFTISRVCFPFLVWGIAIFHPVCHKCCFITVPCKQHYIVYTTPVMCGITLMVVNVGSSSPILEKGSIYQCVRIRGDIVHISTNILFPLLTQVVAITLVSS